MIAPVARDNGNCQEPLSRAWQQQVLDGAELPKCVILLRSK
jgi:hypothetical protein